ncbi:MAG: TrpR-like protein YerC/YecD [Candidatus Peregrinibacteria bacterium Gr01-1014_25]|nr:MAG: TrpR-like protein YerC/YecD [Candidatus Peregrinibacteria bacterium Gr01-1014_25]
MKRRFTEDSWRKEPWFRALVAALRTAARSEEDMENVLRDIGTLSELHAWSERLEIARLIAKGLSYRQVADAAKASTTTVTRVANAVENGTGGYRKVLHAHRHHRLHRSSELSTHVQPFSAAKTMPSPTTALQKYLGKKA